MTAKPPVEIVTREELVARRAAVLAGCRFTEGELRERAADWMLEADELAALTELDSIDYLLGAARVGCR